MPHEYEPFKRDKATCMLAAAPPLLDCIQHVEYLIKPPAKKG